MPTRKRFLQRFGAVGTIISTIIGFATTSWGVVVSAAIGLIAAFWTATLQFFQLPAVQIGVGVFLASLWTCVGVLYLIDRNKPKLVQSFHDYRYGLVFEGCVTNYVPTNIGAPEPGSLRNSILLRNYSSGPIKYVLELFDVRIGTRTIPKYKTNTVTGYMARGAGRTVWGEGFVGGSLQEFYGKGTTKGTVDFSVLYGPPDGPSVRRLKVSMEIYLTLPEDGVVDSTKNKNFVYGDVILSEEDEPLTT